MKKGLVSSIIISIATGINILVSIIVLLPFDAQGFIEKSRVEDTDNLAYLALAGAIAGMVILIIYVWMLLVAITHGVCLIFTIKNFKSNQKAIRIWNYALTGLNVLMIISMVGKIVINLNWEMILNINGML